MAVARSGGLTGASDIADKSAPTLGRRMLALESQLGQELFSRTARGYLLTSEGKSLFEKLIEVEATLSPLVDQGEGERFKRVKLSAGAWVTHYLCNHLPEWPEHQRIPLQFLAADHAMEITHREAVIGIRNRRPDQPTLACQPLNWINFAVYAQSESVVSWAQVLADTPSARWVKKTVGKEFSVQVSHPRNAMDLAIAGSCRVVIPTFIGESCSSLIRVSEDIDELRHKQWLVTHQDDRHEPEVREVINWLKSLLGDKKILD